ncbi:MAG: hypothetical protein ACETWO_03670 [Candidatus Hadarchaeaceae archaeon]
MPPPKIAYMSNVLNGIGMIIAIIAGILAVNNIELRPDSPWPFAIALICLMGVLNLPQAPPPKRLIPNIISGIKVGVIIKTLFILAGIIVGTYLLYFFDPTHGFVPGFVMPFDASTVPWFGVALPLFISLIGDIGSIKALSGMAKTLPY